MSEGVRVDYAGCVRAIDESLRLLSAAQNALTQVGVAACFVPGATVAQASDRMREASQAVHTVRTAFLKAMEGSRHV